MKKLLTFLIALIIVSSSYASVNTVVPKLNASEIFFPVGKTGKQISLLELSKISMKDLQTLTGRKMTFLDKIVFRLAKKKIRNSINQDGTLSNKMLEKFGKSDEETGFHLGGFALGFLLNIIGVLIAYLINDDYKKNRVKWAWIGCSVILGILLILRAAFGSLN